MDVVDRVEPCFIRAQAVQPAWIPFFPKQSDAAVNVAAIILQAPEFLRRAGEAPVCAALSLSKSCGAKGEVLAAVDEVGRVLIVGCPDESAPEPYGSLVADILAASGRLWRMSYEQFSALFQESLGQSLEELVMLRAHSDWDFDVFQPAVAASLAQGRFPVLVVTKMPQGPIQDILAYLATMNLVARLVPVLVYEAAGVQVVEFEPAVASKVVTPPISQLGWETSAAPAPPPEKPVVPERPGTPSEPLKPDTLNGGATVPAAEPSPIPSGALPTEPAKYVAKPPGPGTKPGVMAGKRPPPKPEQKK